MLVPFGTRVVDSEGRAVGTVRHVVLHGDTRQVDGLVVHQGVVKSREFIVPMDKIANAGQTIQLTLRASDLDTLPLFHGQHLRPMPDHWEMPAGFDERDLFMVGGGGWTEAAVPFMETSPSVSGTPAYVEDKDTVEDPEEPEIATGTPVYDSTGQRVGDVESISIDQVSGKITWIVVRRAAVRAGKHNSGQFDQIRHRPHHTECVDRSGQTSRARLSGGTAAEEGRVACVSELAGGDPTKRST
jgi:sporulation protein YlmC with PRC-barrel domain